MQSRLGWEESFGVGPGGRLHSVLCVLPALAPLDELITRDFLRLSPSRRAMAVAFLKGHLWRVWEENLDYETRKARPFGFTRQPFVRIPRLLGLGAPKGGFNPA